MSIFQRKKGNAVYRMFRRNTNSQLYLGPIGRENPERVKESLDYMLGTAMKQHLDTYITLLSLLPEEERDAYVSKWANALLESSTVKLESATANMENLKQGVKTKLAEYEKVRSELEGLKGEINSALGKL